MKLPHRRQSLHLAAGAATLPAVPRIAGAQAYPARPVRIIVGFPAGGAQDIVARLIGQWLAERLGQPFLIENRPGAGGNVGAEGVVRSPADGYTLLLVGSPNAVNTTLYEKLSFNFIRDVAPVAGVISVPLVMVVNPSLPVSGVAEFIAYAKANAGKISMASSGVGTAQHVGGELFKIMTAIDMLHVPYRGGGPALADLIGGQVQVMFAAMSETIEYVRAGKLRALGVSSSTRSDALPNVPTIGDAVPGYEASAWYGVGTPRATAPETVARLNGEINAGLVDPRLRQLLADLGGTMLTGTPADFGSLIARDTEKWAQVIRTAHIKAG
jgi:tripartite-type tricarboxylate transporter receptor subunit TctC